MDRNPFQQPPYFSWPVDRWKLAIILILFFALLITTLFDPGWRSGAAADPPPEMSEVPSGKDDKTVVETQPGRATGEGSDVAVDEAENPALPLTLASLAPNAVVSAAGITSLSGTGQAGSRIEVWDKYVPQANVEQIPAAASKEDLLGVATVDDRGLWIVPLDDMLRPGQHIITVREIDSGGAILAVSSPSVALVLDSGEQGPLSLATPVIRFPAPAARLRTGPTVFLGNGLPGMRVQLFLDENKVAEGMVNTREEWRLTPEEDLAPGVYVALVKALDPQGKVVAESPPVAFEVVEPVEGVLPVQSNAVPAVDL